MKETNYESLANIINPNGQVLDIDKVLSRAGIIVLNDDASSVGRVEKDFCLNSVISSIVLDPAFKSDVGCILYIPPMPKGKMRTFLLTRLFCYAILHEGYLMDAKKWGFKAQPDIAIDIVAEEKASIFARAILMPEAKLREVKTALGHSHQGVILNDVADMFEIDESQVLARWQDLDMID